MSTKLNKKYFLISLSMTKLSFRNWKINGPPSTPAFYPTKPWRTILHYNIIRIMAFKEKYQIRRKIVLLNLTTEQVSHVFHLRSGISHEANNKIHRY
jgi:hypothetical protein